MVLNGIESKGETENSTNGDEIRSVRVRVHVWIVDVVAKERIPRMVRMVVK